MSTITRFRFRFRLVIPLLFKGIKLLSTADFEVVVVVDVEVGGLFKNVINLICIIKNRLSYLPADAENNFP